MIGLDAVWLFIKTFWQPILGAILAIALIGYYNHHVNGQIDDAVSKERTLWQAQAAKDREAATNKIAEITQRERAKEQASTAIINAQAAKHQKEIQDEKALRRADVAAARAGTIKLRDPGTTTSACAGSSRTGPPATTTSQRDGASLAELSAEATEFLLDLANDADAVARQLTSAQAVIVEYQRMCGASQIVGAPLQ